MANKYVYSAAAGAGTGADWANAYTTLAAAFTGSAAADVFYVAHDHAETQASAMTMTCPGTLANTCFVYCVDRAGTVPPVTADLRNTATITTTGANAMTLTGSVHVYGVIFSCGTGAVNSILTIGSITGNWLFFDNCSLRKLGTTGINTAISVAATGPGAYYRFRNTTFHLGSTTDSLAIRSGGKVIWESTPSAVGGTIPTSLFGSICVGGAFVEGVDLSAVTGIVSTAAGGEYYIKDCKLNASNVYATPTVPSQEIYSLRSDSGGTNYKSEKYTYRGTETTETTILRTGGASDGVTAQSRKIVTTANCGFRRFFEALPFAVYCTTSGAAKTITVHAVSGAIGLLNNNDVWIDVEYLSDATSGAGSIGTGTTSLLATGVAYSASGASWAGSPAGTPFSMAVTFTPAQKGWVYIYPKVGAASATVYIDPKVVLT